MMHYHLYAFVPDMSMSNLFVLPPNLMSQATGKRHGIVVNVRSDFANGMLGRKDKLIMGCEREGNYKRRNVYERNNSSKNIYSMKVKSPLRLRYVPNGIGWKVIVRCGMHNHKLSKDLESHDISGRTKDHERKFVNDMMKYNMTLRHIVAALKDKDLENLMSVTQVYKARATYRTGKRGTLAGM
ncbi:uncharacterized protein LOC131619615 [Vicia villosa]|uniref:uncharacterized protein LOC131619615 n=1 Tax=Vicia villosa TaxID=3911 RepID=UPI00273CADFD|nr:uncharacterized protein LOC131619615 [Vicia villosa]